MTTRNGEGAAPKNENGDRGGDRLRGTEAAPRCQGWQPHRNPLAERMSAPRHTRRCSPPPDTLVANRNDAPAPAVGPAKQDAPKGMVGRMFRRAAEAVTKRFLSLRPRKSSRRSSRDDRGREFSIAATKAVARQKQNPKTYEAALDWLSDTLHWLTLWNDNAATYGSSVQGDLHGYTNHLPPRL